jgi:hypothetical protein
MAEHELMYKGKPFKYYHNLDKRTKEYKKYVEWAKDNHPDGEKYWTKEDWDNVEQALEQELKEDELS